MDTSEKMSGSSPNAAGTVADEDNCTGGTVLIVIGVILGVAILLIIIRKIIQGPSYTKKNRIDGKVVIVTGCNTGIGKETVLELAKRGGKIYMACRDPRKCEGARLEIVELSKNTNIFNRTLDLSSLESVRKFAANFKQEESRLDILINNAGIMATPKGLTTDGFEQQLGVNHLGHFLLTNLLMDLLKGSTPSRIVVLSSNIYLFGKINKNDLNSEKSYQKFDAYSQSKLANLLFTCYLSKKLHGTGVTINSCHPGIVKTELGRHLIGGTTKKFILGPFYTKKNRIDGKVVIITGCNTGIGKETALELAKRGAKIYMACRNQSKCEKARLEIIKQTNNKNIFNRSLDLSSLKSVRLFAEKFLKDEKRLDILINNAGLIGKGSTEDGYDTTLQCNHLGHFLLTNLLLDTLKASAHSRIVVVSSIAHYFGKIESEHWKFGAKVKEFDSYNHSKLANVYFTQHLSKLLKGTGVTVNCCHPGVVKTQIIDKVMVHYSRISNCIYEAISKFFLKTPIAGAQTTIKLALDPALSKTSGRFYLDCIPLPARSDEKKAEWLWKQSEILVGLK